MDAINPSHYKTKSGVQCIDITDAYTFCIGNAIKYAWRAGQKDKMLQDLEKCLWYIDRSLKTKDFLRIDKRSDYYQEAQESFKKFLNSQPEQIYLNQWILVSSLMSLNLEKAREYLSNILSEITHENE